MRFYRCRYIIHIYICGYAACIKIHVCLIYAHILMYILHTHSKIASLPQHASAGTQNVCQHMHTYTQTHAGTTSRFFMYIYMYLYMYIHEPLHLTCMHLWVRKIYINSCIYVHIHIHLYNTRVHMYMIYIYLEKLMITEDLQVYA